MTRAKQIIMKMKYIYPGLSEAAWQRDVEVIKRVLTRLTARVGGPGSAVVLTFDTTSYPSEIVLRRPNGVFAVIHVSELEAIVREVA